MKRLLIALAFVALPLEAQLPRACTMSTYLSMARLRACIDTVEYRRKQDSVRVAQALARLDLWEQQGRATMNDFYGKLPPDGKTVAQYVASVLPAPAPAPAPPPAPPPPPSVWSPSVTLPASGLFSSVAASGQYVHLAQGNGRLVYARSTNEGQSFEAFRDLGPGTLYLEDPLVAEGSNVIIATIAATKAVTDFFGSRQVGEISIYRSSDNGVSFTAPVQITTGAFALRLSLAISGADVHLTWMDFRRGVWDVYYSRSTDYGASWGSPLLLVAGNTALGAARPVITASGADVHVAWMDGRDNRPSCTIEGGTVLPQCTEVYTKRSRTRGATWEPDVRRTNGGVYAGRPDIVSNGQFVVVTFDMGDPGGNEIGALTSRDYGANYTPQRLTNTPGPSTHSIVVNRTGTNTFRVAWGDTRDGLKHNYARTSTDGGFVWTAEERVSETQAEIPMLSESASFTHLIWAGINYGPLQYRRKAQ